MLLVDDTQIPIAGQAHVRYPLGGGVAHAGGVCITDQITDQYAPYCSELRYAVSSDYIELADYWWMQQEMNTLSVRHHCLTSSGISPISISYNSVLLARRL